MDTNSPKTGDAGIEQEIVAKGLTAPRVTPEDIEMNISSEHYFTASQGVAASDIAGMTGRFLIWPVPAEVYPDGTPGKEGRTGTNLLNAPQTRDMLNHVVACDVFPALNLLTFCVLVLKNGFTVTGESACASPENFDAELGRRIARANAVNKLWPLLGFSLKEQLFQRTQPAQTPT